MPATRPRKLSTADERREELVAAALGVFAERGYHAAPTLEIARAASISQAYVFRLFPSKVDLFVAVVELVHERLIEVFRAAAAQARRDGEEVLPAMGLAYSELLDRDRDLLLVQMHSHVAAAGEPRIAAVVQRTFRELYALGERESRADEERLRAWFAHGMLCNTMAAIDALSVDEPWAHVLAGEKHQAT